MLKSAGLFYYYEGSVEKIRFNKPALNITEQIELLTSRNLIINDIGFAKNILSNISYYRLSAYMKYFQVSDCFKKNIRFEDVVNLYNFDKDLKSIIFENIRAIEISLRTKICLHMCSNYGSHWFYDVNNYKSEQDLEKTIKIFENEKGLRKDTFIKYYYERYSEPDLPPFWMISEVLSLGDLSKILNGLKYRDVKQIANLLSGDYYISPVITNWMHVLATIRNLCAHHSRLWNRQLKIKFSEPQKIHCWKECNVNNDDIFAVCFVIALLMKNHPYNEFEEQLKSLFLKYKTVNITKMGFPKSFDSFNI